MASHDTKNEVKEEHKMECPICYQECVHPVRLPCNHIFCYLCVKGVVTRNRNCAMCRQVVPMSYLENPEMVDKCDLDIAHQAHTDNIQWFYEARRRGWWVYEKRIAGEIEQRYQEDSQAVFDLQIAGFLYTIDLENMEQYRKEDRTVRRAIKRDHIKHVDEVQGKAGIRLNTSLVSRTVEGSVTSESIPLSNPTISDSQHSTSTPATTASTTPAITASILSHRHSTDNRPRDAVDVSQLVADMNLLDVAHNSSDDEPESIV